MYVQRTRSLNIHFDEEQPAGKTNWNNVLNRFANLFPNPRTEQNKRIIQQLAGQFALPSDEDSFADRSQIGVLSSTPVISTPKNGSARASHMTLPRISAIPRTPLRSVSSLANVSTQSQHQNASKRKSTSTPKASAKKIKTIEMRKTPKSAMHFIEQFNNMESPYNSPLTPNTIKNLNQQQSLYRTYQQTINRSMFPNRTLVPMENMSVQTSFSPMKTVTENHQEGVSYRCRDASQKANVTSSTVGELTTFQGAHTINISKNRGKHTTLVDYDETNEMIDVSNHPDDLLSEEEEEEDDQNASSPDDEASDLGKEEEEEKDHRSPSRWDKEESDLEEEEEEQDNSASSEEEEEEEASDLDEEEEEEENSSPKGSSNRSNHSKESLKRCIAKKDKSVSFEKVEKDTGKAAVRKTLVDYLTGSEDSSSSEEEEEEEVSKKTTNAGLVNSGYLSEGADPLPPTTKIVRVDSDSVASRVNFVLEENTPRPEDFFGIYSNQADDDEEFQESSMPPSSYKSSLSRRSSLSSSSSRLKLKASRKSAVIADSSDDDDDDDAHPHYSGHHSPVYSSPMHDAVDEEEEEEDDHHARRSLSPASASSHSDNFLSEEESDLEEEEEEEKTLPKSRSSRPKHSKESLKRRIAKHLDEYSLVIRPSDTTFDCRRSKRNRVRPVNYWAGERPLYQKSLTKDGNCVSTLVGVSSVRRIEPTRIGKKRAPSAKGKKSKENEVTAHKMEDIFNLSIHKKKLANAEFRDSEHTRALAELEFTESKNSKGVYTAMTHKEEKTALGKLKFDPRAKKIPTKTGNYVTLFNVFYGALLLKVNNDKVGSIIKPGVDFKVDSETIYSIENLRNDEAFLNFTIIHN